jgi:CRP-like cAMP-binding protein
MYATLELNQRLLNTKLLRGVQPSDHAMVLSAFSFLHVPRKTTLFHVGDVADFIYMLLEGLVKISYFNIGGDEKIIDVCLPDDIFGGLFLGNYQLRIGTANALTDCIVTRISKTDLFPLIEQIPVIGLALIAEFADEQRETLARLHALMHTNAHHRFLGMLLSFARRKSTDGADEVLLPAALTQEDLANIASINRSTASLLINQLHREGIIGKTARQITLSIAKLEKKLQTEGIDILT